MPSPNKITVSQLARLIGTPDAPLLVDLCIDEDFALDPRLIPTAFRHPFKQIDSLVSKCVSADTTRDRRVVAYCQKGKKISEGVAAHLRMRGVQAEVLEGGQFGWRDAGLPLVPVENIPVAVESSDNNDGMASSTGSTLWVTRFRPKIDRIACPWLIRRFIDPGARFLFVAPATVLDVAEKFNATAFDVEDVFWTHRGEKCTFDTMVEEFKLDIEPLQTIAAVVRGADTNRPDIADQCAGLLAMSVGLSRMFKDDLEQLEAGMLLYDALYRWARDGLEESHDWPDVKKATVTPASGG